MDRGDRPGLLILKVVGVDVAAGDVLRRWEPVVGGYAEPMLTPDDPEAWATEDRSYLAVVSRWKVRTSLAR